MLLTKTLGTYFKLPCHRGCDHTAGILTGFEQFIYSRGPLPPLLTAKIQWLSSTRHPLILKMALAAIFQQSRKFESNLVWPPHHWQARTFVYCEGRNTVFRWCISVLNTDWHAYFNLHNTLLIQRWTMTTSAWYTYTVSLIGPWGRHTCSVSNSVVRGHLLLARHLRCLPNNQTPISRQNVIVENSLNRFLGLQNPFLHSLGRGDG